MRRLVPAQDPETALDAVDEQVRREAELLGLPISAAIPGDPMVEKADLDRSGLLQIQATAASARAVEKVLDQVERMK